MPFCFSHHGEKIGVNQQWAEMLKEKEGLCARTVQCLSPCKMLCVLASDLELNPQQSSKLLSVPYPVAVLPSK